MMKFTGMIDLPWGAPAKIAGVSPNSDSLPGANSFPCSTALRRRDP
jgi:hypothetical protein